MKSREFLMPLATGLAIFSMSVFISCASTSRIDEDGNEIEGTSVSESGDELTEGPATKAEDNLGDVGKAKATVAEAPPPPAPVEPPPAADALPPADSVPPPGGDLAELPPTSAPPPADSLPTDLPPPPAGDLAAAAPTDANTLPPAEGDALPPPSDLPPVSELPLASGDAPKTRGATGGGGIPKVPAQSLERGGANLNRFYFVRKGDTKNSIAEMIYGDSAKAKDLGKWNKGEFEAGRLVFYQSPQSPDEKEMKPLYQEKNIAPVDYVVKKGDWLSRIAAKKLGSGASWKEIAVLNGLDRPGAIEVGQKLALYPVNGDTQAMAADTAPVTSEPIAAADEPPKKAGKKKRGKKAPEEPSNPNFSAEVPAPTSTEAPLIAEATPAAAIPPPLPTESVPQPETFKKKKKSGGFDILRLIEQNLFFLILGLGVVVLVGALIFVNKRRKAKAAEAEFGDDAFASPKAKRR